VSDVRRLLALIAPHWRWLAVGVVLGVMAIGANIALMGLSAYLISRAAISSSVADLALAITGVRVLAISRAGFRYFERLATHRGMFRILATVRAWFYAAIEPLAPARLVHRQSGDLLTRSVADVDALEDFYIRVAVPPLVAAVVVAGSAVIYGLFDPLLGLVLAGFLLLTGVLLPLVTRWLSAQPAAAMAATRGDLGALVVDHIHGVADLVALDAAGGHRSRLLTLGAELDRSRRRLGSIEGVSTALSGLFASLAGLTVLALVIPLVTAGEVEGVFLAVLPLATIATFEAVQPLSRAVQLLDSTRGSARRLFELIDEPPSVIDPEAPAPMPDTFGLEVRDLSFRYAPHEAWVLRHLDVQVAAGERVALVGPSGCGKSTLLALLLRFWDYQSGSIRVGDLDLRELDQEQVRRMFSVVPQDVHLFNATIEDNLALADGDADLATMTRACRLAQLEELIEGLPDGYHTVVGEDGLLLSGGERRRLAIARAIIKDAPIVIFDEATADLDGTTEAALWTALDPWLEGKTVLTISHRPTIAAHVDRVVDIRGMTSSS
jgi:thiol reductant ABC exporter CydC subunit